MSTVIEFKNFSKSFGARVVLSNLNLKINQGEIVFILGTSGTGKSVLLKNIVGLMKPTSGEIWVKQKNVTELSEEEFFLVRQKCGMVFQQPALFDSINIYENIAYGLKRNFVLNQDEIKAKVDRALRDVNLGQIQHKMPQEISYGMQKRVSLARTIAVEPEILLFDEPTTGLDPISTTAINELIRELSRKMKTTSVVVSHDIKCALGIADRILFLDKGQVVEDSAPDKIRKSNHPLVREFLFEV